MDELVEKIERLYKSLLSLKSAAKQDKFVPAIKPPTLKAPSIKQPSKIPSALPPPSKKDPVKVAQQLKNPRPGKVQTEILKVEDNGQWSLSKEEGTQVIGEPKSIVQQKTILKPPVHAQNEGFAGHHGPEQNKLLHGLNIHDTKPMGGSIAGAAHKAFNPETKQNVILKRASGHQNQDLRGHLENGFNSAKREVLFHNLARDFFGMGHHVPTTAGFSRGGEDYSVQELQPNAKHADLKKPDAALDKPTKEGENPFESSVGVHQFQHPEHGKLLNKLHESGDLHKLAMMDNIMGHHDRHAGNYMMDEKGDKLHLIDNGTAFDYKNFDPNHYPAYLRHTENPDIEGMGKDNSVLHPKAQEWLNKLDPEKAKELLTAQGYDPNSTVTQGFLRRLQGMKNSANNGVKHYKNMHQLLDKNRLTSGPIFRHEALKNNKERGENPW